MQRVTILNSEDIRATIQGDPGFGPWERVSGVQGRLSFLLKNRAKGLIDAHEAKCNELTIPLLQAPDINYRQELGPVALGPDKATVTVEIHYEIQEVGSNKESVGKVVFQCR